MAEFPKTREEQLRLLADQATAHLARPAEGADPELEAFLESLGPPPVAREIESEWTPDVMGKLTGRPARGG
jgi:hypothetical protein